MADGDLHLSESPNVDTGLVEKDGSLHRTVLTAVPEGTLQLSDSANVSTGYVTDSDGKKHKVNLVAEVTGSLELSDNPSVDTGYVTDGDGKKHKVKLTASLHGGGGGSAVIDTLNVTPSTSAQTIIAPSGTDGYSPVNVSAVTSAIDANITSSNIKSGITILGVSGSVTELNGTTTSITPTTSAQTITPTSPNNGFTEVNVSAVTSSIDANITAGNIKKDVSILGVTGSYEGVAPSGTKQITTNGTHDVAGYANADVQVPTTAPDYYVLKSNQSNILKQGNQVIDLTGITDLNPYVLSYAYYSFISADASLTGTALKNANSLTTISGMYALYYTFYQQKNLTSTGLNNVKTISGLNALNFCFGNCSGLTTIDMDNLEELSGATCLSSAFAYCTSLVTADFPKLAIISVATCFAQNSFSSIFAGCTKLQNIYFRAVKASTFASLQTQLQYLCNTATGSTATGGCTIHFPSNFDPSDPNHTFDASTLAGYPTFGGSASYIHVAFDLPATES